MKISMKTLCTVGALLLCSESALAMTEVCNEIESTHRMTVQSFNKEKESTETMRMIAFPSIADCVTYLVSTHNVHLDDNTVSSIKNIIKYYDVFIRVNDLLEDICDLDLNKQQLVKERSVYQNLLDQNAERQRIVEAEKAETEHLRIIDESIKSVAQMFNDAEIEVTVNDAMEASAKMFDDAEIEADKAASQAIVSQSSYFKFGQFLKSMWSKFTESRLGRTLNLVRSYFFQN